MLPKPPSLCSGCPLFDGPWGKKEGFAPGDSHPDWKVLLVAEALGEDEELSGHPLVGKSGQYLWGLLKRVGIYREDFYIANVLACRPPDNKLAGEPYEQAAIRHCGSHLDNIIRHCGNQRAALGKPLVILTLGKIAFKRILDLDEKRDAALLKADYLNYPFWSDKYGAYVVACDHPAYLVRGSHHLASVLQFGATRAIRMATEGFAFDKPNYILDPDPSIFEGWISDYRKALEADPEDTYLSYDIETPMKNGNDEEDVAREDDDDYTILRCSFSYRSGHAVSVPWRTEYMAALQRLFFTNGNQLVGWNCPTPEEKVLTSDLRWVEAGTLKVGDTLVGFDEEVPADRKIRRYKESIVTHAERGVGHVFRVTMSDESSVKVTKEHPWLIPQRNRTKGLRHQGGSAWVKTEDLKIGQSIFRLLDVWKTNDSREAGYLAGFFDGEGHLSYAGGNLRVGAAQNEGETLDYVLSLMNKFVGTRGYNPHRTKDSHLTNFVIATTNDITKFLGSIRPQRLLNNFKPEQLNSIRQSSTQKLVITSIEDLGEQEIVQLSTSSKTYVLEGFAAHNSVKYDDPRVKAQIPFYGQSIDAMYAWHVLNSALPKGLGFVSPFYNPGASMWKHLSDAEPAFYNAKDADMALGNWLGIKEDLKKNGQWEIFKSHQIEMGKVFSYMSSKGVLRDNALRDEAEKKLQEIINGLNSSINEVVPFAAKKLKAYKKTPKSTDGLVQVPGIRDTKQCPACGAIDVKAEHFKSIGKKRLKAGETENPCFGLKAEKYSLSSQVWAEVQDFKLSKDALTRYQNVVGHFPVVDRRKKTTTFDEKAILRLRRKYPKDQLYPLIGEFREHQKLLGTYIGITQPGGWIKGGLPVDQYGLIHTQFTDNPSTLRSASQNPNLQNLPRPSKDPNAPGNIIRRLIIAHPGCTFLARDYSGIEAVLVGYFARSPGYIRLAKHDVHSFYTAYALHELDGRIAANDLPLLSWDDEKLFSRLAEIKKEFNEERNALYKHLVHGANFMQGPAGAAEKILAETGREFPIPLVKRVMDIYFELFPDIRKWHKRELLEADETGYSRNPFGYVHRFNKVFQWEKVGGQWQREQGPDANRVIAFKPQSTAAGIIKEAMMRMFFNRFEEAGQYLRLLIHDEVFTECPEEYADTLDTIMQEEMERPIMALPLPSTWGMGTHLVINTEAKKGPVWGLMK